MILKSERSVRRLLAAHNLTIHTIRHNKHWVIRASRDGGPVKRIVISTSTSSPYALQKIEAELRRLR